MRTVLVRFIFICITTACSLLGPQASFAQGTVGDSSATARHAQVDSVMKPHLYQPNPKKAGLYSAIVPGLGQAYNHEYWKIPVIYVGLGVAGYFIADNLNNYQTYRKAYIGRINNPYPTDQYVNIYTTAQLQQLQSDYDKYLDLTVLFTGVGYMLQIIDAVTSAHLKNFDISRDISMQVSPMAVPHGAGLGMVVNFR